jgi:Skp family chaperone for outer membrane proteins
VWSDGLDPLDLSGALAGPPPRARKSESSSSDHTADGPVKPVAARQGPAVVARTLRAVNKADAIVERLIKERSALDGERDGLEKDVKALQQQFDELETRRADLDLRDSRLDTATRKATTASRNAHRAAEKAQTSR